MELHEIKERMLDGRIYDPSDSDLLNEQSRCQALLCAYNALPIDDQKGRDALTSQMFAAFGENSFIQPPFYANWGGRFVRFGHDCYANFNLTLVDDGEIIIGNHVMFGPGVTLTTAGHPIRPDLRRRQLQFNLPIHIGDNVWIGANVTVLPGITIGENSVIGAGSIVTHNIPANVVAVGTPCRVLREINEHDHEYYAAGRKIEDIW